MATIERFTAAEARAALPGLIDLLIDAVDSGASLGFLPPLAEQEAHTYWTGIIADLEQGKRVLLVALQEGQLVGSVQLELATKPNAPHRAEVQKLMVHTCARNRGIGRSLMLATDDLARSISRTLLVLDTREGDVAEQLYTKLGYTRLGSIPQYVRNADGVLEATVVFYRHLADAGQHD
jgi:acetyltransferase